MGKWGGSIRDTATSASVDELEFSAHILRRLTFGPIPGGPEHALRTAKQPSVLIDRLLSADPMPFDPPADIDVPFKIHDKRVLEEDVLGNAYLVRFWLERMRADDAGFHEKMMWFWHTLFTTSGTMGTFLFLWRQLRTLHENALGNLRTLANALVIDPAMMQFLNSDTSLIRSPNENLGRELMELFLMGRGNYTEEDVRAAALGLAGWRIDFTKDVATFEPEGDVAPATTLLGRRAIYTPELVVDQILTQPAVATHIVQKLWRYLIGGPRDDALVARWAAQFRSSDYEIAPLVETMAHSEAFLTSRRSRPRSGVEWLAATVRILEPTNDEKDGGYFDFTQVDQLGQVPYFPPNVAGWPDDAEWLSSSTGYSRASYVAQLPSGMEDPGGNQVEEVLRRSCVYDVSEETRSALEDLQGDLEGDGRSRAQMLAKAVVLSPEFALA